MDPSYFGDVLHPSVHLIDAALKTEVAALLGARFDVLSADANRRRTDEPSLYCFFVARDAHHFNIRLRTGGGDGLVNAIQRHIDVGTPVEDEHFDSMPSHFCLVFSSAGIDASYPSSLSAAT